MDFLEFCISSDVDYFFESPKLIGRAAGIDRPDLLEPATGKPWRQVNKKKELEQAVKEAEKKQIKREDLWVTFTDVPRLGIYYEADDGSTPLGLYAYPASYVLEKNLDVPYGSNRMYMLLFKIINDNIISIKSTERGQTEPKDLYDVVRIIGDKNAIFRKMLEKRKKNIINFITKKGIKLKESIGQSDIDVLSDNLLDIVSDIDSYSSWEDKDRIETLINDKFAELLNDNASELLERAAQTSSIHIKTTNQNLIEKIKSNLYSRIGTNHYVVQLFDGVSEGVFHSSQPVPWRISLPKISDQTQELLKLIGVDLNISNIKDFISFVSNSNWIKINSIEEDGDSQNQAYFIYNTDPRNIKQLELKNIIFEGGVKQTQEIIKMMTAIKENLIKNLDRQEKLRKQYMDSISFPLGSELKKYCAENGLDWHDILYRTITLDEFKSNTTGSFVYNFTRIMARELSKKTKVNFYRNSYYRMWTKILRDLGVQGLVDPHGTSTIHSSESTQGVFFNPRQFKLIKIITNRSVLRQASSMWKLPKEIRKRKNKNINVHAWSPEDSPVERYLQNILRQANYLSQNFVYENPAKVVLTLTILLRTYAKTIEKNKDINIKILNKINKIFENIFMSALTYMRDTSRHNIKKEDMSKIKYAIISAFEFAISKGIINLNEKLVSRDGSTTLRDAYSTYRLPISSFLKPGTIKKQLGITKSNRFDDTI